MQQQRQINVKSQWWWLEVMVGLFFLYFVILVSLRASHIDVTGGMVAALFGCVTMVIVLDGIRRLFKPAQWVLEYDDSRLRISTNGILWHDGLWSDLKIDDWTCSSVRIHTQFEELLSVPKLLFSFEQLARLKEIPTAAEALRGSQQ